MARNALVILVLLSGVSIATPARVMSQEEAGAEYGHEHGMEEFAHEDFPRQESMLMWTFKSLGWRYTLALPVAGLFAFVLAVILVVRGGSYAGSALLFVVPIPLLVGVLGLLDGLISAYQILATPNCAPRPWEMAEAISTSLVTPFVGMLLMAPAYLVAMGGLFIRAMAGEREIRKS